MSGTLEPLLAASVELAILRKQRAALIAALRDVRESLRTGASIAGLIQRIDAAILDAQS